MICVRPVLTARPFQCSPGNYYCYDNPAALKTSLDEFAGLDEQEYNLLYTVYSVPNVILPFFGGYLCDMLGAARATTLFAALLVGGQVVFAFGTSIKVPILDLSSTM